MTLLYKEGQLGQKGLEGTDFSEENMFFGALQCSFDDCFEILQSARSGLVPIPCDFS